MTGALCLLFDVLRKRSLKKAWLSLLLLAMAAWILRGPESARSTSSLVGTAIGLVILAALSLQKRQRHRIRMRTALAGSMAICVVVFAMAFRAGQESSVLTTAIQASGRDVTLTDRTDLWTDLMDIAAERPLLGVGYGAFWIGNTHNLWDRHLWRPNQGHNGYLDVYLELGVVGLVLLLAVLATSFLSLLKQVAVRFDQSVLHLIGSPSLSATTSPNPAFFAARSICGFFCC